MCAHIEDAEIHLLFRKALVEAIAYGRHVNLAVVTVRIGHLAGVFRHTRVLVLCHPEPVNRSVSGQRGEYCCVDRVDRDFVLCNRIGSDDVADQRIEREPTRGYRRGDLCGVVHVHRGEQDIAVLRKDVRVDYVDLLCPALASSGHGVGCFYFALHASAPDAVILIFERTARDVFEFPQQRVHREQRGIDLCDLL